MSSETTELELPWIEKYRPTKISEIVGNRASVQRLAAIAKQGNMPNLILSGQPGTGKTTSIICLAKELLGNAFSKGVLELNASDDRGIDVVRNRIKNFAQQKVTLPEGRHKVVILDEADNITSAAQQALRRTIELHSDTTRFALACNMSTKIIEPIQSRCAILRYQRLSNEEILSRLQYIIEKESISYTDEGIELLMFIADGDMRQIINALQATVAGFGHVSPSNVLKVCDTPHPADVALMINECVEGKIRDALKRMEKFWKEGYAASDIIGTVFRVIKYATNIPEYLQLEFLKEVGMCQMRIVEGVATLVQLLGLIAKLTETAQTAKMHQQSSQSSQN